MKKVSIVSVKRPSNAGGAEIVWENLKKQGMKFDNVSLDTADLPKRFRLIPNAFHLKEIFASKWLMKKALAKRTEVMIYDKIFGWLDIETDTKEICYNHGSYTIAGLTFKDKNYLIYLIYKYVLSYFERKSYENADKIIAVSESVKDEMVDYFGIPSRKIVVVDNAVDLKKFRPMKNKDTLKKKFGLPVNKKIIFFPGRASFGKGFDIAEKVLKELGDDYFMFVLGEGKSELDNVKFIGKISNDKMVEVYNCADLCLFPSRYEGGSISVLESAACGVPLVLSGVGLMKTEKGMKEFVCGSVDEYVSKVKNIDLDSSSRKWREFVKGFSIEKQVRELGGILGNEE